MGNFSELEAFCDHCQKDTVNIFYDNGHERDSSGDSLQCIVCGWHKAWDSFNNQYAPEDGWEESVKLTLEKIRRKEKVIDFIDFDDVDNYRGNLQAKKEGGKYFWRVSCEVHGAKWQEIPEYLWKSLLDFYISEKTV